MSCLSFENLGSCGSCKIGNLSRACMMFVMQLFDVDFDRPSYIRFPKQFSNNIVYHQESFMVQISGDGRGEKYFFFFFGILF